MSKQASSIYIYKRCGCYYADSTGCFGGGYKGAYAGSTPAEAALFALREKARYISNNKLGGNIFAPDEVFAAIEQAKKKGSQAMKPKGEDYVNG